ncbi:hypothetical protein AYJ66_11815 [Dietzia cinnamea]|nr:hypothetical protein AYJ66_11815 [Dietzia cinnamea]
MLIYIGPAAAQPADERTAYPVALGAFWLFGMAVIPIRVGFRDVLPNRVVNFRGATWVLPRAGSAELLLLICAGSSMAVSGVFYGELIGWPSTELNGINDPTLTGPLLIVAGASFSLLCVWQMLRGIRMTPESITYWRGIGRITLAWDELGDAESTNDVRDHDGYRKYLHRYQPGAKIVVPPERVSGVMVRVRWESVDTPRLLLETDYFTVEPSALLTAILALRDRPELRSLLGTRASKHLFVGPPWRVRRHMYRTQQWWPKGAVPDGIAVDRDGVGK